MSRGGPAPGWGWWPPSRRRGRQQQRTRRRVAAGSGFLEGAWAFPVAVLAVAGLAAASLSLLVLVLGLSGAALSLIVAAVAAGSWIASSGLGGSKDRRGTPLLTHRISFASKSSVTVLANGGPSMSYSSPDLLVPERRRGQVCGDHLSPSTRFMLTPRRRYPIQQAQYAALGTLPSICWDEYRRKNRLSIHHSSMAHSPVTVKIARPESNIGRSPLLEQLVSPVAFSSASNTILDPCAKETVLNALKESRKRAVEEEEEEQNFPSGQENKKRRHDSTGSGHSAFEPLVANGAPASLVPMPGSLKRGLASSHCLEDCSSKRSRTSSLSSVNSLYVGGIPSSLRNAIASSYSSTRGLSQLWKRTGPSSSPLSSPASSRSQTPERPNKKARYPSSNITEEEPQKSNLQMPVTADKEMQEEKISDSPLKNKCNYVSSPSSSGSNGKRKRKIQLLSAHHGDNFALPPPPQLGYTVTPEDLDAEKKATLQWFNKILEENIDSTPSPPVETTSSSQTLNFSLMSTKPTPVSLPISTAATNPLLESLKNMQEGKGSSAQAAKTVPGTKGSPQIPAFSASLDLSSSVPVTSPEAPKPLALNVPVPLSTASPSSGTSLPTSSTGTLVTASSEPGHTPSRPSSAPKPSILFGILTSPPVDKPSAATTPSSSAPSTVPIFKPVFGSPAKSENFSFSPSSTSVVSATAQSVPSLAPPVAPSSTFKPIFGPLSTPATAILPTTTSSSPFTFSQAPQPAAASGLPAINASSNLGLPILSEATAATSVSSPGTASVTFVSMSKPVFSFGPGIPSSATAPSNSSSNSTPATVVSTLASQPLLFGAAPSASTAAMPLFQFGKQATSTGATVNLLAPSSTTNSAPTVTAAATTTTNTGFSIFSGGSSSSTQASSAPSATTQGPLTFGSCTSAFSSTFGAASKPPPPYAAVTSQLAFDAGVPEGQQAALKPPAAGPLNFGTPFSFTGSVAQPAAQPAFGSSTQTAFGGSGPLASFGAKNTSQPAFGVASSIFSFGTATTSSTQTTSTGSSVFGGSAPAPFTFGVSNPQGVAGSAFGVGASATGTGVPTVGFGFGSGQSGAADGVTPFGTSLAQNPLGTQNQNSAFAFNIPSTPESKPAFGGTPTPTFGQSTPTPGGGTVGSCNFSLGTPITPTFGGVTPTAFGIPTFSIGAGSKTGTRQRLQARRQHTRKK
ncbi:nuclear envelope pore membrane protein POM 121-like isoform X2 [Crotalus tigris]|uniref:nuclear envelope pore membrane protein POM 121-like isoform X2 n=1 Tax=Crotalus tigris TaxID=88082 RepID=UPI00192F13D0|nr:nuclear envelope pore membrane protein POM 121-like isoform X2 [Crotalus tigris]